MATMIKPMKRNFLAPKLLVPFALILWLLVSLAFMLLIPPASAQVGSTNSACPTAAGSYNGNVWGTGKSWWWYSYVKMGNGQGHAPATGGLRGVYSPSRFDPPYNYAYNVNNVSDPNACTQASGTVTYVEPWGDGDWDIYVKLDPQYLPGGSSQLVSQQDITNLQVYTEAQKTSDHQAADMIWEVVHGDKGNTCGDGNQAFNSGIGIMQPKYTPGSGSNTSLTPGDKVQVLGGLDYDSNHSYHELHRLYQIQVTAPVSGSPYSTNQTCTAAKTNPKSGSNG